MGRKGGGRKAFLKTAKPADEDGVDVQAAQADARPTDKTPKTVIEDPSVKFLVDENPATSGTKDGAPVQGSSADVTPEKGVESGTQRPPVQEETKGQLVQRHKKVYYNLCLQCMPHLYYHKRSPDWKSIRLPLSKKIYLGSELA